MLRASRGDLTTVNISCRRCIQGDEEERAQRRRAEKVHCVTLANSDARSTISARVKARHHVRDPMNIAAADRNLLGFICYHDGELIIYGGSSMPLLSVLRLRPVIDNSLLPSQSKVVSSLRRHIHKQRILSRIQHSVPHVVVSC